MACAVKSLHGYDFGVFATDATSCEDFHRTLRRASKACRGGMGQGLLELEKEEGRTPWSLRRSQTCPRLMVRQVRLLISRTVAGTFVVSEAAEFVIICYSRNRN